LLFDAIDDDQISKGSAGPGIILIRQADLNGKGGQGIHDILIRKSKSADRILAQLDEPAPATGTQPIILTYYFGRHSGPGTTI
jgi:hypothetical protein